VARVFPAGGGVGRRRGRPAADGAVRGSGRPSGSMARGGGLRARAGALHGGRAAEVAQPWRRDDVPAAAAPDSKGKEVGKIEEVAIELTVARFGAEDGRERELDGEGEARRGASMVDGVLQARFGQGRVRPRSWRDGGASGRGRAALARWVEAGQREGGEGRPEGERRCSARLGSRELKERDGMDWTEASRAALRRRAAPRPDCRRVASSPATTAAVWASGAQYRAGGALFTRLNDFGSSLTS